MCGKGLPAFWDPRGLRGAMGSTAADLSLTGGLYNAVGRQDTRRDGDCLTRRNLSSCRQEGGHVWRTV